VLALNFTCFLSKKTKITSSGCQSPMWTLPSGFQKK
jgi:hypothetical protein